MDANDARSLRHYLLKEQKISKELNAEVVLAESANQIYRDTTYKDLITFEQDIAVISSMVLVIAESSGSLAELGAFSSNDTIRRSLTILMQEKYENSESFIRHGPVEKVIKENRERVAFFPWNVHTNSTIDKKSASPHVSSIIEFVNGGLNRVPQTTSFSSNKDLSKFVLLYWIIHLSLAIPLRRLTDYAKNIIPDLDESSVSRMLYCMQLAGWVDKQQYSNQVYYFCRFDADPIRKYTFNSEVAIRDSIRRKIAVTEIIQSDLSLPRHVRETAAQSRNQ